MEEYSIILVHGGHPSPNGVVRGSEISSPRPSKATLTTLGGVRIEPDEVGSVNSARSGISSAFVVPPSYGSDEVKIPPTLPSLELDVRMI